MTITRLITGDEIPRAKLNPSTRRAHESFDAYLHQNVKSAETLRSMGDIIREFKRRTPRMKVTKCIDGRVHNSKSKGYPPSTVTFSRTEGNNVDLAFSNTVFWSRIDGVVMDAKRHTPGMPALFIALGHRSNHGHGCAAHGLDDARAFAAVKSQAQHVRKIYDPSELYVLYGMTNTDDMSESIVFPDGTEIDASKVIGKLHDKAHPLHQPSDVFQEQFLDHTLDDYATDRYVGHKTPREFLSGSSAPMYRDLQTALAMEAYLVREISRISDTGLAHNNIVNQRLFKEISKVLDGVKKLPKTLRGPLLYQIVWNVAYTLYQRRRFERMNEDQQERHLDHAEELVCYGDGFEMLMRNKCVLVKTGRGNDEEALQVAMRVLLNNRKRIAQRYPPLVHINVEVSGEITTWDAFNDLVLSKSKTMLRTIYNVFGKDVRVLISYSYKHEKKFYPIRIQPEQGTTKRNVDERESYPIDVTRLLIDQNFTRAELERRENAYSQFMMSDATFDTMSA